MAYQRYGHICHILEEKIKRPTTLKLQLYESYEISYLRVTYFYILDFFLYIIVKRKFKL